jgi:lysophospholipase
MAYAIFTAGLAANIEMDFENAVTLAEMGITTYFVERYGEGGSDRPHNGTFRQRPALIEPVEYARDLLQFVTHIKADLDGNKPLMLIGVCYGCLMALQSCILDDHVFDCCFLTSPMLGLKWLNGAESEWVFPVGPETDMEYVGKARDWSWPLAQKLIANDATSHDSARGPVRHLWLYQYPRLRIGGFTYGFIHRSSVGVSNLFEKGVLEQISTPVFLISASEDVINDNNRHSEVAARLPNAKHYTIEGARHGLWRETDEFRNQMLQYLAVELDRML